MDLISGGQAGLNSVMFYNRKNKVKASRNKNGRIRVEITPLDNKKTTKLGIILDQIPFVRGIWLMLKLVLLNWRLYLITFGLLFSMIMAQKLFNSDTAESHTSSFLYFSLTPPYHFVFLIGLLLCAGLFIKLTEVGKYHSAEHMVDNAYKDSQDISLQSVQRYSRVHKDCGTNLLMFILIFYFILYYLLDIKIFVGFISFSFGYEVYRIDRGWIKKALTPIYALSHSLQWLLFTSKPDSKHLEVSIAAYQEIINLSKTSPDI